MFSRGTFEKIARSPLKELVVTDTIRRLERSAAANLTVVSVAPLFAQAIYSIHRRESVSRLFGDTE